MAYAVAVTLPSSSFSNVCLYIIYLYIFYCTYLITALYYDGEAIKLQITNYRLPPPPADSLPPHPILKPYSSMYPRPFGTQSSSSYTEFRRTTSDFPLAEDRQFNDEYQKPVPESAAYRYGNTASHNPATDYDNPSREATR